MKIKIFIYIVGVLMFMMLGLQTSNTQSGYLIPDGIFWNGTVGYSQYQSNNWTYTLSGGYGNSGFRYNYNLQSDYKDWGSWRSIGIGSCDFWVHIPAHNPNLNVTKYARYWLKLPTGWFGQTHDQSANSGRWFDTVTDLNPAAICSSPELWLVDSTGEISGSKTILYDDAYSYFPNYP